MHDTFPLLEKIPFPAIRRGRLDTLQVNLGYRCNQSCVHCHVGAGPHRTEQMSGEVADTVLAFLERRRLATLDITGGAPELNPHFRRLVTAARGMGARAMDRCNLTIFEVEGQQDLPEFLAGEQVEIVASMPCYLEGNGGLTVAPGPAASAQRGHIVAQAARHRLPAVYPFRYFAADGGLASYGVDNIELFRRAASYVDRILKGEKLGDLPVQLADKYELVINLKTAKALGLDVPMSLLARTDEVIE